MGRHQGLGNTEREGRRGNEGMNAEMSAWEQRGEGSMSSWRAKKQEREKWERRMKATAPDRWLIALLSW